MWQMMTFFSKFHHILASYCLTRRQIGGFPPLPCVSYIPLPTKEGRPAKLSQSKSRLLQVTELSVSVYFVFLHLIIVVDSCIH